MDYTAPDKQTGDQWTWQEHNMMKEVVNSRQVKALVQDLNNPNSTDYPSTQAIIDFLQNNGQVGSSMSYKGGLTGNESIVSHSTYQVTGFWIAGNTFNITTTNVEFPVKAPGIFRVWKNEHNKVMEYITTDDYPRYFIRSSNSLWVEVATSNYLTVNNYCQCTGNIGNPSISITDNIGGGNFTLDKNSDTIWSRAKLTLNSSTILNNPLQEITIDFDFVGQDFDAKSVVLNFINPRGFTHSLSINAGVITIFIKDFDEGNEFDFINFDLLIL